MPKRKREKVHPAHAYCMINPKGRIMVSTCRIDLLDCWQRAYTEEQWIAMQKEGWYIHRVEVKITHDNKNAGSGVS